MKTDNRTDYERIETAISEPGKVVILAAPAETTGGPP